MALRRCASLATSSYFSSLERGLGSEGASQFRSIGSWVPEFFGKKSKYTEGTAFLGTPRDHQERIKHRPISPDVLDIDGKTLHYKFPLGAISSITNRVTGVGMSVGLFGAGFIALTGDLPGTVDYIKSYGFLLAVPIKFMIAFPVVYHFAAGVRHLLWDTGSIGNNADKGSMFELPEVEKSSQAILAASAGIAGLLSLYYYTV